METHAYHLSHVVAIGARPRLANGVRGGYPRGVYVALRRWAIRVVMPVMWRLWPRRRAHALAEFAATEADSGWQFKQAIERTPDPALKALLFCNLLEEMEHSERFQRLADGMGQGRVGVAPARRTSLATDTSSLRAFIAYVHAGELDISHEFDAYGRAAGVPAISGTFEALREDEEGHQSGLWSALRKLTRSDSEARSLVRRARWRRLYRSWLSVSKQLGDAMLALWLGLAYLLMGPLAVWSSRARMRSGHAAEQP